MPGGFAFRFSIFGGFVLRDLFIGFDFGLFSFKSMIVSFKSTTCSSDDLTKHRRPETSNFIISPGVGCWDLWGRL